MTSEGYRTPKEAEVVQVIRTVALRGDGKETIVREVVQFWDFEGNLLAESDPCAGADRVVETFPTKKEVKAYLAKLREEYGSDSAFVKSREEHFAKQLKEDK